MKRILLGAIVIATAVSHAQTPEARPQFEVASIKRNTDCGGRRGAGSPPSPGRMNMECITLRNLIQNAYLVFANGVGLNLKMVDIVGGPGWMESDTYDLAAKAEGGAPVARMMGPMMQMLLEDRFKLKIHRETKEAPVYILTVAKGGAKLEPTKDGSCVPIDLEHLPKPGEPRPNFCGNQSMRRTGSSVTMTARGITMSMFTGMALPQVAGRPIIDKTGLAGEYDIQIDFAPDNLMPEPGGRGGAGDPGAPSADTPAPSIFAALQQLGLKLEAGKGPVEILVIDHVERPSEN